MSDTSDTSNTDDTARDAATGELEQLRAELAKLQEENLALKQTGEADAAPSRPVWRRRWLSVTAAVLGAILLPVAVITVWTRNTVLDTDQYVETMAPLARNADIQETVGFRVSEAVTEAADFEGLAEEALPDQAQILAGPIASGAQTLVADVVTGLVETRSFQSVWDESNRVAHEAIVPLLEGRDSDLLGTSGGQVRIELGAVVESAVERLDEQLGTSLQERIPEEELDAQIVLVDSSELADAQDLVRVLDNASWLLVILALVFLAGAVLLSERRRLGVRRLGIAVVAPMVLALLGYAWARSTYLDSLPADVHNPDAAAAVFDILTRFLQRAFRALLVLGALILAAAWVTGPSASAARVREWWGTLVGRAGAHEAGPVARFVGAQERTLGMIAIAIGVLTLVLWTRPTGLVVLLIVAVTLVVLAVIRLLAEVSRRSEEGEVALESNDPEPGAGSDAGDGPDPRRAAEDAVAATANETD